MQYLHPSRHNTMRNQQVTFDAANPEHIEAFRFLIEKSRQHPTLRFKLEFPHLDIRSMMTAKVVEQFLKQNAPVQTPAQPSDVWPM